MFMNVAEHSEIQEMESTLDWVQLSCPDDDDNKNSTRIAKTLFEKNLQVKFKNRFQKGRAV